MKTIYICHPLRGNHPHDIARINANYNSARRICERLAREETDVLILSPLHAFSFFPAQGDQTAPLRMCLALLGKADELRVYGNWQSSEGCCMEIEHALSLGIPVAFPEEDHGDA